MQLTIYQIDAFTNRLFGGNPAAVIPLKEWLPDTLMQKLALENNLSETVFFVPATNQAAHFDIRWFTPTSEINLCGHASLAAAYVLFHQLQFDQPELRFASKSGILSVTTNGDTITMDFPSWQPERVLDYPPTITELFRDDEIVGVYQNRDWLVELTDQAAVEKFVPDFSLMKKDIDKLIITAPGKTADFVSRFFAPGVGVDEDPVTGSAHAQLIPFWSEKLGKQSMFAQQLSARGGDLWCTQINKERVTMAGQAVFYMKGTINC